MRHEHHQEPFSIVDIGRFWQWLLFLGPWLTLVGRALWPAIARPHSPLGPWLVLKG